MDMEMKQYWPQEKLFFIASCALFPDKIIGSSIKPDSMSVELSVEDEKLKELKSYASKKMLKFMIDKDDSDNTQYTISSVDQDKFHTMLVEYLKKFRNDELLAKPSEKPEPYTTLRNKLYQYLQFSSRKKPTVNPYNIWTDWYVGYGKIRPFWEILLTSSELSPKTTKIINIGYKEVKSSGFGDSPPASFAEVEIINDKVLKNALTINASSNQLSGYDTDTTQVTVIVEDRVLYALINQSGKKIPIKRFRTDSPLFNFMHYLKNNHDKDIARGIIQTKVEGCASKNDMTELVRRCGFTRDLEPLKEIFFPGTTNEKVHFRPMLHINQTQLDLLNNYKMISKNNRN